MNSLLAFSSLLICALIVLAVPTLVAPYAADYGSVTVFDTAKAILLCGGLATLAGFIAFRQSRYGPFLLKLFVVALLIRLLIGTAIFVFNGQAFFGGDALTYDFFGFAQLKAWGGERYYQSLVHSFIGRAESSGWGMVYLVASVYGLIGRNMLAMQFVTAVMGAATAP